MSEDLSPSERQSKKLRQQQRERQLRREAFILELMASIAGREFIWDLLSKANVFAISFVPGQPDLTAFNEGKRNFGLALLAEVQRLTPSLYLRMTTENTSAKIEENENE